MPGTPSGLEPKLKHLTHFADPIDDLAFVPTMGALHDGHLALIKEARNYGSQVGVSIYVNPTQFESKDDLAKYPKTLEKDLTLAEQAGANFVWTPSVEEIYPEGISNVPLIPAGPLGDLYEGASRPNHFSGVLTVINRLFRITNPQYAIFGEKDFQQLFLIRKFAQKNFPNISIISGKTIRDESGLALSSRNARLTAEELKIAYVLSEAQRAVKDLTELGKIRETLERILKNRAGFTLDYIEVVNPETLLPISEQSGDYVGRVQILLAGWIGSVRLIDNFSHEVKGQL